MSILQTHPIANIFPMMPDVAIHSLASDIKARGLLEPITLYQGKILDGRNRYAACVIAGVEPKTRNYDGKTPAAFVWSENRERRHLDAGQVACAAVKAQPFLDAEGLSVLAQEEMKAKERQAAAGKTHGRGQKVSQKVDEPIPDRNAGRATSKAAEKAGTNRQYIADAKKLQAEDPVMFEQVASGEKKITEAKRQAKRAEVIRTVQAMPSAKYRVLYADPPWSYGDTRDSLPGATGATTHYPTMSVSQICALPIADLAEDNSVLFLWATSPLLPDALRVVSAWGFVYKASFVWDKVKHNLGHYNSVRHELLLIGTHGSCMPDSSKLINSVQRIERGEHSVKPPEFRTIIETMYTVGRKLELFARAKADGWEAWGNEV